MLTGGRNDCEPTCRMSATIEPGVPDLLMVSNNCCVQTESFATGPDGSLILQVGNYGCNPNPCMQNGSYTTGPDGSLIVQVGNYDCNPCSQLNAYHGPSTSQVPSLIDVTCGNPCDTAAYQGTQQAPELIQVQGCQLPCPAAFHGSADPDASMINHVGGPQAQLLPVGRYKNNNNCNVPSAYDRQPLVNPELLI